MKFHLSESHFPWFIFGHEKPRGWFIMYTHFITICYMYIVGAPNFPCFFCGHIFYHHGNLKRVTTISWGPHLPGVAFEGPEGAIRFPIQAALLAPHMGHLNFSLKNAPSRPLAEEDKKRVGKAAVKFALVNEKQRNRWMTGLTPCLRGESWFFV